MSNNTEKTDDKPRKVKTSKEIASQGLIKRTKFTPKQLAEVHMTQARRDYSWMPMLQARDAYGQKKNALAILARIYNIPVIQIADDGAPLISQPALDYVLNNAPELLNNTIGNSLEAEQKSIREEAQARFKAICERELEEKFKTMNQ
jgi:hypothetical protein